MEPLQKSGAFSTPICQKGEKWPSQCRPSLVPRPFVGETAWQLTRVQTVYRYDVKEIAAPPLQAMNIG